VKLLIRSILLISTLLGFSSGTAFAGYEDLFQTVRKASWAIYVRSVGGMSAVCSSGAFDSNASRTLLLTAGHCFLGSELKRTDFLVTQDHRTFYKATLLKSGLALRSGKSATSTDLDDYSGHDWAILTAEMGSKATLPIGDSEKLIIGEDLVMVGVPFGVDFLAVQGIVGSKDVSLSSLAWNHYYGANIYSAGGNSGSVVISTKQKTIVGILAAGPGGQSSMAIFLPIHLIPNLK